MKIEIFYDNNDKHNPGWVARIPANQFQSCDWILDADDPNRPEEAEAEVCRKFPADTLRYPVVIVKD